MSQLLSVARVTPQRRRPTACTSDPGGLEDPRLAMMMAAPKRREDAPESDRTFVYLTPQPGTLYLWESFVRHEVTPNQAKADRISLSFNYR